MTTKDTLPIPVRFKETEVLLIQRLQELTGLSRSDLVRRACRYAFPKFLDGDVNMLTLQEYGGASSRMMVEAGVENEV